MKTTQKSTRGGLIRLFLCSIIVTMTTMLFAQPRPSNRDNHRHHSARMVPDSIDVQSRVDRMSEQLKLSDDQYEKILEVTQAHFAEVRAMQKADKEKAYEARKERNESRQVLEKSIMEILSEEQASEWEKIRPKKRQKGSHRR